MLKNDGLLPLAAGARVGVVGEFAQTPRFQGAGSSQVNPTKVDVLLDELRATYGDVPFAAGYGIGENANDAALLAAAEEVAGAVDTVVVVIGLPGAGRYPAPFPTWATPPASCTCPGSTRHSGSRR